MIRITARAWIFWPIFGICTLGTLAYLAYRIGQFAMAQKHLSSIQPPPANAARKVTKIGMPTIVTPVSKAVAAKPANPPLGLIRVSVGQRVVQEGDTVDLILTIRNELPGSVLYPCVPKVSEFMSLGYRLKQVAPRQSKSFETLPSLKETLRRGHGIIAPYFRLKGNESRDFPILLFGPAKQAGLSIIPPDKDGKAQSLRMTGASGLFWLPPGTYEIEVLYRPITGRMGRETKWDERVDMYKTLVSEPFRLTIMDHPPRQRKAVALAKDFLMADLVELKPFLKSYRAVLVEKLSPSLEKRVRFHVATTLLARSSHPEHLAIAIDNLQTLAGMMLTPGEAEQVHYHLARYCREQDQASQALRWASNHTTPWAERLRMQLNRHTRKK